jgi:hypothetical protein
VEFSEDSLEFKTIIRTMTVNKADLPLKQTFEGETRYSARVKGVKEGLADSKWSAVTTVTGQENILSPMQDSDIAALTATVRWVANSDVTHLLITPGNVQRTITADEKTAGVATISGLTGDTQYTVELYRSTKKRGTVSFKTLIDLQGATAINPGDNLRTILDAAAEGASFVIMSGTFNLGNYTLTKSVKLRGYLSSNKPIIQGQFTCGSTVALFEVKNLIIRGNADPSAVLPQFFNTVAGCNLASLSIVDSEISHYQNSLISCNASATYGTVSITGSYVHDILPAGGGDGIDFRLGTITSFAVENTTFANGFRAFLRMQIACNTSFKNCTFYKLSALDNSNNTGLFRTGGAAGANNKLEVRNCLFVATGVASPTNIQSGNWCRNAGNMVATPTYANNNIFQCLNLLVGLNTTPASISATEIDPGFVDAANGNFKVTNQTIKDNNIGDPRWLQ